MRTPIVPKPGEPLRAGWYGELVRWILARTAVRVVPPLEVADTPSGPIIRLREDAALEAPAVVVAVRGGSVAKAEDITYDVRVLTTPGGVVEDMTPKYGRLPTDGTRVRAAEVGDRCRVHRRLQGDGTWTLELEILSEKIHYADCAAEEPDPEPDP